MSEWLLWLGVRQQQGGNLAVITNINPSSLISCKTKQADCSAGVQTPTRFISETRKNSHNSTALQKWDSPTSPKLRKTITIELSHHLLPPDFEVWHKLHRD